MVIAVLALAWVAVGVGWLVGRLRESREERSISHFHEEHEVLSRRGYSVPPAHRLDEVPSYVDDEYSTDLAPRAPRDRWRRPREVREPVSQYHAPTWNESDEFVEFGEPSRTNVRPALRLVGHDDTRRTEFDPWEEWDRDNTWDGDLFQSPYDGDEPVRHRYTAYHHAPHGDVTPDYVDREVAPRVTSERRIGTMSMRRRRRLAGTVLGATALATTGLDQVASSSLVKDVSYLAWFSVGLYGVAYGVARVTGVLGGAAPRRDEVPVRLAYRNDQPWAQSGEGAYDEDFSPSRRDVSRMAMG